MQKVDPDILYALKALAVNEDSKRVQKIKAKHEKQTEERFQTQLELLADEVDNVIPRNNPLFMEVLMLAVTRKIARSQREPEFISDIEAGWPQGW